MSVFGEDVNLIVYFDLIFKLCFANLGLYTVDLIVFPYEQLLESFEKSFPTLQFPPLPDRGDLDLKDVLASPYFFNWLNSRTTTTIDRTSQQNRPASTSLLSSHSQWGKGVLTTIWQDLDVCSCVYTSIKTTLR